MISRSFTWIDDDREHTEYELSRAAALAKKWCELKTQEENRRFRLEMYDAYDPYEDCECETCLCLGESGTEFCEVRKADEQAKAEREAERDLEIELIEDKLEAIGARMMRPYEHWNEDEKFMEWSERERD